MHESQPTNFPDSQSETVTGHTRSKKLFIYIIPFILLLIAYSPAFAPFGVHNDYSFLEPTTRDWWLRYDESWWLYRIGRPLGSLLMSCQMLLMNDFMSFAYWRVFAALLGGVLSLQLAGLLISRTQLSALHAILIGTGFALLPAAQVSVIWLTMLFLGLGAPIVGALAYQVLPASDGICTVKTLTSSLQRHYIRYVVAMALLILAMLIYPGNAIIGLAITAAIVFTKGNIREKLFLVGRDSVFFGCSMLIYFIIIKSEVLPLSSGGVNLPEYQLKLTFSLYNQLRNFLNILYISFSSPWNVSFGSAGGLTINAALFTLLGFFTVKKSGLKIAAIVPVVLLTLLIFIIASLPVLLAPKGYYDAYRTSFIPQCIVWLALGTLAVKLSDWRNQLATYAILAGLLSATGVSIFNAALVRKNNLRELSYMSEYLTKAITSRQDLVYLLKVRGRSYSAWPTRFEFALPVTHPPHLLGVLANRADEIASSGINIGTVDENGLFSIIAGNQPSQNALICDLQTLDETIR